VSLLYAELVGHPHGRDFIPRTAGAETH